MFGVLLSIFIVRLELSVIVGKVVIFVVWCVFRIVFLIKVRLVFLVELMLRFVWVMILRLKLLSSDVSLCILLILLVVRIIFCIGYLIN